MFDALDRRLPNTVRRELEGNRFRLKVRVEVSSHLFIDVFYAPRTARISFALIRNGRRAFGIDNLSGWHVHPVTDADQHVSSKEMTVRELVDSCGDAIERVGL